MAGLGRKNTCEPNFEILYRSTTKKTRREYHRILSERTKKNFSPNNDSIGRNKLRLSGYGVSSVGVKILAC
jgi:hypothetical protein